MPTDGPGPGEGHAGIHGQGMKTRQAVVISHVLLRAPALPAAALATDDTDANRETFGAPPSERARRSPAAPAAPAAAASAAHDPDGRLVKNALALAGEDAGERGERSTSNYRARMAFRPTPAGLFAGVFMGRLGPRTTLASGGAGLAHLVPRYARLASLARALLDEPAVRRRVQLRISPSLLLDGGEAMWLAPAAPGDPDPEALVERTMVDPLLGAVIEATAGWSSWPRVAQAVSAAVDLDPLSVDEYLLVLVDGGLLISDLSPSLIGPPPLAQLRTRLAPLSRVPAAASVRSALAVLDLVLAPRRSGPPRADDHALGDRLREARRLLATLPARAHADDEGTDRDRDDSLVGVLELQPTAAILSRDAVLAAAAAAPTVMRLAAAFCPPWERATSAALDRAVRTLLEEHEPGAYDLAGLSLGRYATTLGPPAPPALGVDFPSAPATGNGAAPGPEVGVPPAPLLRFVVEKLLEGGSELRLDSAVLDALLPPVDLPPSFELFLSPCREKPGEPDGSGWLLGLHGPAGSTWGRFAAALGGPLADAMRELLAVEKSALGEALGADLEYAPSAAVADVAAHPAFRETTLALTGWPTSGATLRPADLELVLGPALYASGVGGAPLALALRERESHTPLHLSQLSRIRSATVGEDGIYRLLVGFSLQRASFPWALHLGALGSLARLPRIVVDGFVVAPASFRVPAEVAAALRENAPAARALVHEFRRVAGLPRHVQAGEGDQMLPVDLERLDEGDLHLLTRLPPGARLYEIWPPLDRLADSDGRRVEAVVAVVRSAAEAEDGPDVGDAPDVRDVPDVRNVRDVPNVSARRNPRDTLVDAPPPTPFVSPVRRAGTIDPTPDPAWTTFRLYGAPARADHVLAAAVFGTIAEARRRREIDGWFFLRYVDEAERHHLRLRVRREPSRDEPGTGRRRLGEDRFALFSRRLAAALAPLREDGTLSTVERGDYRPERARYGGPGTLRLVERVFESDSDLVLALIALDPDLRPDGVTLLVRSFEALARGLGLDESARRAAARAFRATHEDTLFALAPARTADKTDALAPLYRLRQPALLSALDPSTDESNPAAAAFLAHEARLSDLLRAFHRERDRDHAAALIHTVLPSLLHLAAVRLVGTGAVREAIGSYLWERVLASAAARARTGPRHPTSDEEP